MENKKQYAAKATTIDASLLKPPQLVIFDLEGTLSNSAHRKELWGDTPDERHRWNLSLMYDRPNHDMIQLFMFYANSSRHHAIILTAKPNTYKPEVEAWLIYNLGNVALHTTILMRQAADQRSSPEVKEHMMQHITQGKLDVILAIDDRQDNCDMFTRLGVPTLHYSTPALPPHTPKGVN